MKRRSFLKAVSGVVGAGTFGAPALDAWAQAEGRPLGEMPRRVAGRTGETISIIGYPGLGLIHGDQKTGTESIHRAFDNGVNYFDVAPAYGNGDSEIKMGIGLQGIPRDKIFLACKTKMRDRDGARKELERSLKRLKTDHFDLYQLHALRYPEEVERALGPGGALETFLKAREEGKVRFFGFSAHTTKAALAALNGFAFHTVMFPINFIEMFKIGFGKPVLELAQKKQACVLAIKPMCGGAWPKGMQRTRRWWYRPLEEQRHIDLALRFTLSQAPVVAGIPPAWLDLLDKALITGRSYRPITEPEIAELRKMAESRPSVFIREERKVALGPPDGEPLFADSPHECCPCRQA
ncbi:MAG TPA: aldo/keto reductase [Planctomycetaceae bacterium]|nr:aldo/keto reductase [Planctomycetaceae bacterium]